MTGSGKVKRKQAYLRHNMRKRSQDVKRALRKKTHVTVEDLKLVERLLPNR
ncbi:MAG: 50S ribosomal protein L35 [SAR324 cluster bacterium]|nr:50S ribosomal protein L35 [SAR324 cluster bacterium]